MGGAELLDLWGDTVLAAVLADLVHGLHIDEERIAALESEPYGLESLAALVLRDEASEDTYAVVDVDDIVADVEGTEFAESDALLLLTHIVIAERHLLEAVEDLVIGIETDPCLLIDKAGVESDVQLGIGELALSLAEDGAEALELAAIVGDEENLVGIGRLVVNIVFEEVEILLEEGLRDGLPIEIGLGLAIHNIDAAALESGHPLLGRAERLERDGVSGIVGLDDGLIVSVEQVGAERSGEEP